jgi:hypothetical protein
MFKVNRNSAFEPENKESAMRMNSKIKIRLDAIEPMQRALESLPEFRAEQVTKSHAVQMLTTQIRAAQAKGYSLESIGRLLAEGGVPIPIGSLRAYLSEAAPGARKRKRRAKGTAQPPKVATERPASDTTTPAPAKAATVPSTPATKTSTRSIDGGWEPARKPAGTATRGGFDVRPDEDLDRI